MSAITTSRLWGAGLAHQVLGVSGQADHLQATALENPHDPLSDQRLILADDNTKRRPLVHELRRSRERT